VGWFVRVADLTPIAATTVRQSIGGTSLNLLGGVFSFGAGGLILSATVRSWIGVIILVRRAWQTLGAYMRQTSPLSALVILKKIWRKYVVSGSTGIVNTCGLLLPTVLISTYFTPVELGWYALMQSLATGPVGILTGALGQSFWAEARQLVKRDPVALRDLFLKTTKRLMLISLPVAVVCLLGPFYVGPIFGLEKWAGAGSVLAALTPFILTQIIVSTLSPIIVICGQENWLFIWDVVRTIMIISVFTLAHLLAMQFIYAISTFSMLMALMYLILYFKNLRLLKVVNLS
jgi:O-antigen/teichoic acid export membrane protein